MEYAGITPDAAEQSAAVASERMDAPLHARAWLIDMDRALVHEDAAIAGAPARLVRAGLEA